MSLFQKSVVNKYLAVLDDKKVDKAFDIFKSSYSEAKISEIQKIKEEEYQDGFLRDLFVNVLGYILKPEDGYNLTREYKNQSDAKKADGAIIKDGKAIAVIELKSTKTHDLTTITSQAFGYRNNQPDCHYVITSNFQQLRFYIDYSNEWEEFDLFNLDKEEFKLLYLLLSKDNVFSDLPLTLKEETKLKEKDISEKLYNDYSNFKNKIYQNLVKNNSQYDKLTLFKKSQKFLDRLLFIFFAEDTGLIPPNTISIIIDNWKKLKELDAYSPLYNIYKKFFVYFDKGSDNESYKIPKYNGGLFATDEILDELIIDDEILKDDALLLSEYDFNTDIDVNILGHIFEHSLSEIEEITAEIEGREKDNKNSKRKKDGVFYTPQYITQYIVENTVGKLCSEKRKELDLIDIEIDDSYRVKGTKLPKKGQVLLSKLEEYKKWLLSLKILDPACGSGAFLNQALNFLIAEHKQIDGIRREFSGDLVGLFDTDKAILENNLYGVDINEESVEIAKLSLWLRTAQKGRELSNLSNNIKCGNSLIDDPDVAGDKAFNWKEEFKDIFDNGGFDVVIGNPPYGAKLSKKDLEYVVSKYSTGGITKQLNDTYIAFYIISSQTLLKKGGALGFIAPNTWRLISSGDNFRNFMLSENIYFYKIVQHLEKVFSDATVDCDTVFMTKSNIKPQDVHLIIRNNKYEQLNHYVNFELLKSQIFFNLSLTESHYKLKNKIESKGELVSSLFTIKNGIKPYEKGKGKPPQTAETMKIKPFTSNTKITDKSLPLVGGRLFHRFKLLWNNNSWIEYGKWLAAPRDPAIFDAPEKLIFRQTSDSIVGTKIGAGYVMRNNTHILLPQKGTVNLNYSLGVLNSTLTDYYYSTINPEKGEAMAEVKAFHLGMLILPIASPKIQSIIEEKVVKILELNENEVQSNNKFISYFLSQHSTEKLSNKLKNWHTLEFSDFIKELNKIIKTNKSPKLSISDEMRWMDAFNEKKLEAVAIKEKIEKIDNEIDEMVFDLYGLTDEERAIVCGE